MMSTRSFGTCSSKSGPSGVLQSIHGIRGGCLKYRHGTQLGLECERQHQECRVAQLLREAQRAIDCGDAGFSAPFRLWLLRALGIGRRRDRPRETTLAQYRTDLKRRLDRIMAHAVPQGRAGSCAGASAAAGSTRRCSSPTAMPPTNNVSERALRPSVVPRKVTNGFRSEGGAETCAAFRSVVSTARVRGNTVLSAVQEALHSQPLRAPG